MKTLSAGMVQMFYNAATAIRVSVASKKAMHGVAAGWSTEKPKFAKNLKLKPSNSLGQELHFDISIVYTFQILKFELFWPFTAICDLEWPLD